MSFGVGAVQTRLNEAGYSGAIRETLIEVSDNGDGAVLVTVNTDTISAQRLAAVLRRKFAADEPRTWDGVSYIVVWNRGDDRW